MYRKLCYPRGFDSVAVWYRVSSLVEFCCQCTRNIRQIYRVLSTGDVTVMASFTAKHFLTLKYECACVYDLYTVSK